MQIPRATYRLQLNKEQTLQDLLKRVDEWYELGISHLYLSPITMAAPGSMHGYDVTDYTKINPEIGSESDLELLAQELKARNMGILLDIVPNHMAIGSPTNLWWQDVLQRGPRSTYWNTFDIQGEIVILPLLGESVEEAIEKGLLTRKGDHLCYGTFQFPLCKGSLDQGDLQTLIQMQHYRLLSWKEGNDLINYRRFFDINTLAGVRCEDPDVFDAIHAWPLSLYRRGLVQGFRIDHIDGLLNPASYVRKLRAAIGPEGYLIVEKILVGSERLRLKWPLQGTTGYDFLNLVNGLFVNQNNHEAVEGIYQKTTGDFREVEDVQYESKQLILSTSLISEVKVLGNFLPGPEYLEPLKAIIASFPVYRTYMGPEQLTLELEDCDTIALSVQEALRRNPHLDPFHFHTLQNILLREMEAERYSPFIMRFQQLTGPAMAKGYEDTTLYRIYPLSSLNEVGSHLQAFGTPIARFHSENLKRLSDWPNTLLASSTHDTKRSEDVRARLNVLSEIPQEWREFLERTIPLINLSGHTAYLLLQSVVGTWQRVGATDPYIDRIVAYMLKAAKEAKIETSWMFPNLEYEEHLENGVRDALSNLLVINEISQLTELIRSAGELNALAELTLRLTVPGVPDTYQGMEVFAYRLVDPDNRNIVDFGSISTRHPKRELLQKMLQFRKRHPSLFSKGEYVPLNVVGETQSQVIAFSRSWLENTLIVAVSRFFMSKGKMPINLNMELPEPLIGDGIHFGVWHLKD